MRTPKDSVLLYGLPPSSLNWDQRQGPFVPPTPKQYCIASPTPCSAPDPLTQVISYEDEFDTSLSYMPALARVSATYQLRYSIGMRKDRQLVYKNPIDIDNTRMHQLINQYLSTANLPLIQPYHVKSGQTAVFAFWSSNDMRLLTHVHIECPQTAVGLVCRIIQFKQLTDPYFSAKVSKQVLTAPNMTIPIYQPDEYCFYVVIIDSSVHASSPCDYRCHSSHPVQMMSSNELRDVNGNIAFPRNGNTMSWGPPSWPFF